MKHPPGLKGFLLALSLLLGLLILSTGVGILGYLALEAYLAPPGWTILVLALLVLVPGAILIGRLFPWLTDWYYFLPALSFLLVFTLYPIALTVYLAFTDYSGRKNGFPDRSTETRVLKQEGPKLILEEPATEALRCNPCEGEPVEVYSEGHRARARILEAEGNTLVLDRTPPFQAAFVAKVNAFRFVGLKNFAFILSQANQALLPVFLWNVVFAASTVLLNALLGLILGLILNNKGLKLRNFYRTVLIISWALPGVITVQVFVALLNYNFGAINRLLGVLGIYPIPWLNDPDWAKVAILLVNLWLGFPYMMTATLGALSTIPDELYEAAKVDGATPWQALWGITLPLLEKPMVPILLSSFAFNFNNFYLIYLLTGGGPAQEGRLATAQATDILISWAYKTAFSAEGQSAYGLGAAISLLIFAITVAISLVNFRITGALREVK
ncbi:sugar ABC transporter permease [Thermus scotoductus]|uniref:Maltose/maltodextrin transport system permease protein n=1 Tax=Thermus scotoductus TaxID=37636 RepID=A0A430RTM8_THESC|nr:ABC transporter permease subunit [Thermus scotoductus]RTG92073.1 sugar ABC transporter permease [Thermus scotoductus]RTH19257.1 sugar ABC transporter permease [Thermus scotoductus]RTH22888.1 sugar ABC transporter permease [Thermus scotoductus]RTH26393.1 sugar ABC transporter permease [Thermus scotoductus]RTH39263.1 sugar ABC transporter permease [Thermus scotoductus]